MQEQEQEWHDEDEKMQEQDEKRKKKVRESRWWEQGVGAKGGGPPDWRPARIVLAAAAGKG